MCVLRIGEQNIIGLYEDYANRKTLGAVDNNIKKFSKKVLTKWERFGNIVEHSARERRATHLEN